ncbi:MAG: hypothetical protein V1747_09955 [Candidatus Omnitrophota bacterium]
MAKKTIRISQLEEHSDERGVSFSVPAANLSYIKKINNMHFATIMPGAVRGNHYHEQKKECLLVIYSDAWIFSYQEKKSKAADV